MRFFDASHREEVRALAFAPDSRALAVMVPGRGVTVHDLAADRPGARTGPAGFPWRTVIGFEPGGVLAAVTAEGRTRFDPATAARLGVGPHDPTGPGWVQSFAASPDGARLVTVQSDHLRTRLIGWAATADGWQRRWSVDSGPSSDPAVSAAGDRVAVVTVAQPGEWGGYKLFLRDTDTGEVVGTGGYPYSMLGRPQYRPDGRQVVTTHEMTLLVWDTRMPAKPHLIRNDSRRYFTGAAYHPSGRFLLTTSNDATVCVWDTDAWTRVARIAWDIGGLRAVAVSPDGLLAAAGSERGRVVVWDVDL